MASLIPLDDVPNQELTVRLDDARYVLRLKVAGAVMVADITRDGVTLLQGTRVLAGEPILPYKYQEAGNFLLITDDDELPAYEQFGVTQSLVYLSIAEIEALQSG